MLQGHHAHEVVGTKLGVGGLGRAYARAVRELFENAALTLWKPRRRIEVELPYEATAELDRLLQDWRRDGRASNASARGCAWRGTASRGM